MVQLVKFNAQGTPVMSSMELAEFTGQRHDNMVTSIKKMFKAIGEEEHLLNFQEMRNVPGNNGAIRQMMAYSFPEKEALFIASKSRDDVRWKIICEFEELKKAQQPTFKIPQTFKEALMLAVEQQELLELQAPKVEYCDSVLNTSNTFPISIIAKDLGMSPQALNKILGEQGIQYKQGGTWMLYAEHQDKGWTRMSTNLHTNSLGEEVTKHHMKWTEKGREAIMSLFK